jgi:hypothetical protein
VSYPQNLAQAALKASVGVSLMVGDKEIKVEAKSAGKGVWEAILPSSALDSLKAGTYAVVAESGLGKGDSPGAGSTVFLKF